MSVVIIGGNDCMVCQYKTLCSKYNCTAKVFTQMTGSMKNKIGSPDLMILFTGTVSHKMVQCAMNNIKNTPVIERSHSSSISSLRNILDKHISNGGQNV